MDLFLSPCSAMIEMGGENMRKIHTWYNNLEFRKKLVIWFLLLALLPILFLGAFTFQNSLQSGEERYMKDMAFDLRQVQQQVQEQQRGIELRAIGLGSNKRMIEVLSEADAGTEYMNVNFQVEKMLYEDSVTSVMDAAYIFSRGEAYTNQSGRKYEEALAGNLGEYQLRLANGENGFWGKPIDAGGAYTLPFIRGIKDYGTKTQLGLAIANYDESRISGITSNGVRFADNVLVVGPDGTVLSSWDKALIGSNVQELFGFSMPDEEESSFYQTVDGRKKLFSYYAAPPSGWRYLGVVDYARVIAASDSVIVITIAVLIFAVCLCALLAFVVSKNITKPIKKLIRIMDAVEDENLTPRFIPLYTDEIGRLTQSFNNMTQRLRVSLAKTIEMQLQHQKDQYDALTSQINSHFFYNTLSSIIWLTNRGKKEEVIELVNALSRLFRITVSEGAEFIRVRTEVECVRSYLEIQQIRYQDRFKFIFDVETGVQNGFMIKTVLQPLVENAIYHGIKDAGGKGTIRVIGKAEGENLVFEIWDNGRTAKEAGFERINYNLEHGLPIEGDHGIGLKNVNDRIRFHFGRGYGVTLHRVDNQTVCMARMKQRKGAPDVQDIGL